MAFCIAARLVSAAQTTAVQVEFEHRHNGEPLQLDSLKNELPTGETYSIDRLSYLVSGFALRQEDGSWLEVPNGIAWIDASRRRTTAILKGIPTAAYRGIRFSIGLSPEINRGDPAQYSAEHPLNPNLNGLHWGWQGGYIFLALEGRYRSWDSGLRGYSYHLARDQNRTTIALPVEIEPGGRGGVRVIFDIGALLIAPKDISFDRDGESTHSRDGDPIAATLSDNLLSAFRAEAVSAGPSVDAQQTVLPIDLPARFTPYRLTIGSGLPIPALPRDNPLIEERVRLGKRLFEDPLLSRTGEISCSTCHDVKYAFANADRVSLGVDGRRGTRNAMPLFNLAWKSSFFWDGRAATLRQQVLMPIQDHAEMDEGLSTAVTKLGKHPDYPELFAKAFKGSDITAERMALSLENYLLTLVSNESKFDRAMQGTTELSREEKRGFELFFTEYDPRTGQFGADCFHCHGGPLFTDNRFHNNGLMPNGDPGVFGVTGMNYDRGKFVTPSLRNVAVTGPYMHDGRFATLEQVIQHYSHGVQRSPTLDPNLAKHPNQGVFLRQEDQAALVAFLRTLTDEGFLAGGQAKVATAGVPSQTK
jgi:cytochrome c peroxidase